MEAEQVARNDAIYRAANERIEAAAEEYEVAGPIPFICECADATCTNVVLLTLTQYERIRGHPTHFLNLPGHELPVRLGSTSRLATVLNRLTAWVVHHPALIVLSVFAIVIPLSVGASRSAPRPERSPHPPEP